MLRWYENILENYSICVVIILACHWVKNVKHQNMNGMASSRHKCRSTEIRLFFAIININHKHVTSKFMSFKQSFTFF